MKVEEKLNCFSKQNKIAKYGRNDIDEFFFPIGWEPISWVPMSKYISDICSCIIFYHWKNKYVRALIIVPAFSYLSGTTEQIVLGHVPKEVKHFELRKLYFEEYRLNKRNISDALFNFKTINTIDKLKVIGKIKFDVNYNINLLSETVNNKIIIQESCMEYNALDDCILSLECVNKSYLPSQSIILKYAYHISMNAWCEDIIKEEDVYERNKYLRFHFPKILNVVDQFIKEDRIINEKVRF